MLPQGKKDILHDFVRFGDAEQMGRHRVDGTRVAIVEERKRRRIAANHPCREALVRNVAIERNRGPGHRWLARVTCRPKEG